MSETEKGKPADTPGRGPPTPEELDDGAPGRGPPATPPGHADDEPVVNPLPATEA